MIERNWVEEWLPTLQLVDLKRLAGEKSDEKNAKRKAAPGNEAAESKKKEAKRVVEK